jgi:4-amino-4-deoxy-L-arabinose transferase-like glycosyltransferase
MNGVLAVFALVLCGVIVFAVPSMVAPYAADYGTVTVFDTSKAVLLCTVLAFIAGLYAFRQGESGTFLLRVFIAALLLRVLVGTLIFAMKGQEFFGGDAITYDFFGSAQLSGWGGDRYSQMLVTRFVGIGEGSGWGMVYLVAAIYGLIGRNMLAVQLVNAVLGAVTAPIIYLCAQQVFNNVRVSRFAALAVAFYPSLVLWSSQGLKDAAIVFFLTVSILATLKLGQKTQVKYLVVLIISLFSLLSLRFYVFYMIAVAIGGAFLLGMRALTPTSFIRQFLLIILLGLGLTYMGVTRYATKQFETYGTLQSVNRSRQNASTSAQSGFERDVDVSTTAGAISTIPVGLLYLLFAPFPWQLASLRQSITLPEMVVWWASFPMLVLGFWFSIKYRLRMISPILLFTVMLSLAYSVFQGNVGTAYRQRAQLLVFYFIFVAVGYVLMLEKREEKKKRDQAEKEALAATRFPASTLRR